jgi:hypothetical protein
VATLTAGITAAQRLVGITDGPVEEPRPGTRYVVGDELLQFEGFHVDTSPWPYVVDPTRWRVVRGIEGTEPVAHDADAEVTEFDVTAGGEGGDWDDLEADHDAHDHTGVPGVGGGAILTATVDLSAADIATLSSVPVQVVATPGANKVIVPVSAAFAFTPGVAPFTAPSTVGLSCLTSASIAFDALSTVLSYFLTEAVVDAPKDDEPLMVQASEEPDGSGDGTARITVAYFVMDLA